MKSVLNNDPQAQGASGRGQRVRAGEPAYFEALDFLVQEAELLDQNRFGEWFELLDTGITYQMPVRVTVRRADGDGFAGDMAHFDDDYASLGVRVRRFDTQTAWAEDPPSRAKRLVTNVRVERVQDSDDELRVLSYLLLLRSRWDSPQYEQILAERDDVLRRAGPGLKLLRRMIRVEQSNLGTINMALFL